MSATIVDLGKAVLAAIEDKRDNATAWNPKSRFAGSPGFVLSGFEAARSWLPHQALDKIPQGGKLWVCHLAEADLPNQGRSNTTRKEIPIQIAIQKVVDHQDLSAMDTLAEFVEQVREVCRLEVDPSQDDFSFIRIEPLADENETPYAYAGLREGGFFEAYFTVFYNYVLA